MKDLFQRCGINESEQRVLLHLLEHGDSPAARIARTTGMKRPNTYAVLDSLVVRGLVVRSSRRGGSFFSAVPPKTVIEILRGRAEREFHQQQSALDALAPQLTKMAHSSSAQLGGFEVSTIESQQTIVSLLEQHLLEGHFSAIFNPQVALSDPAVKKTVAYFLKESAVLSPPIREIAVAGPASSWYASRIRNKNHLFKTVPRNRTILSDMIISKGTVTLLHYQEGKEVAFRIRHEEYSQSMQTVFDMLWDGLE